MRGGKRREGGDIFGIQINMSQSILLDFFIVEELKIRKANKGQRGSIQTYLSLQYIFFSAKMY